MSNAFSGQRQFAQGPMMGGYGGGYGGGGVENVTINNYGDDSDDDGGSGGECALGVAIHAGGPREEGSRGGCGRGRDELIARCRPTTGRCPNLHGDPLRYRIGS